MYTDFDYRTFTVYALIEQEIYDTINASISHVSIFHSVTCVDFSYLFFSYY